MTKHERPLQELQPATGRLEVRCTSPTRHETATPERRFYRLESRKGVMDGIGEDERKAEIASTRAFFAPRAAGWEDRFPDDGPSYEQAVAELEPPAGGAVLDAACADFFWSNWRGAAKPPYTAKAAAEGTQLVTRAPLQMAPPCDDPLKSSTLTLQVTGPPPTSHPRR